jgi:hypothetical protein
MARIFATVAEIGGGQRSPDILAKIVQAGILALDYSSSSYFGNSSH